MAGNKKAFLFVNRDWQSPSLNKSTAKEQSSINSHVQRGRRHHRQSNASSRPKRVTKDTNPPPLPLQDSEGSSSAEPPTGSSFPVGDAAQAAATNEASKTSESAYWATDSLGAVRAQQTSDGLVNIASPTSDADIRGHDTTGGLLTPKDSPQDITQLLSSVDPFQNSSIALDAKTHGLIQYYKTVYHPAVWHVETRATSKGEYAFQTTSEDVIRSALSSDVDMYALLAGMASRLQYVDKVPGYSTDEYLGKALAATRRFIAGRAAQGPKSHEEILMVIFHLYAAEGYRNNIPAAKIHMKGAKTIVAAIGGLNKLRDPQMQELLIIGDGLLSAMTLQPCELPCEFDPGSYLDTTPEHLKLSAHYDLTDICPALRHRPHEQIIPLPLQNLVDQIAELNWVLVHAKSGSPEASKHATRWLQMRSMALRHRLLEFIVTDPRLDVFRSALVLWIVTTTTLLGLKRLALVIAPQLRAKLQAVTDQNFEFAHLDIKAWTLSLGAMSAMPGSPDATWYIGMLADMINAKRFAGGTTLVGTDSFDLLGELRQLQESFFYHEAVHGEYLQALAMNIAQHTAWHSGNSTSL